MSNYSEDSDWKLLRATLDELQAQKKPDVVLIAGDFLVHEFPQGLRPQRRRA